MNTDTSRIHLTVSDQIAYVELARPQKHNALDIKMFNAIVDLIKQLKNDRDIRAVIVSGQGQDFCTGLDVKSVMGSKGGPMKLIRKWLPWRANLAQRVSTDWSKIPVPVIMVIQGRCWGGGLQIALGADFRIAEPNASLSILEGRWGLIPDMGGTLALRQNCRIDVAKQLAMTAEFVDGTTAQQMGLITHVSDDPMQKAKELATTLSQQSPDAIAGVKRLFDKSWFSSKGVVLFRESFYQMRILPGKNMRIKSHNQTHDASEHKPFVGRKKW